MFPSTRGRGDFTDLGWSQKTAPQCRSGSEAEGRCSPVPWGTLLHSRLGFLINTVKTDMALTSGHGWGASNKEEMSGQLRGGTRKSTVWLSFFIIFPLLPLPLSNSDKCLFQVTQQWGLLFKKIKTQPQNLLGGTDRGQKMGPWRVQLCTKHQCWLGKKKGAFQIHSIHVDPAQDHKNISDKGIHS